MAQLGLKVVVRSVSEGRGKTLLDSWHEQHLLRMPLGVRGLTSPRDVLVGREGRGHRNLDSKGGSGPAMAWGSTGDPGEGLPGTTGKLPAPMISGSTFD